MHKRAVRAGLGSLSIGLRRVPEAGLWVSGFLTVPHPGSGLFTRERLGSFYFRSCFRAVCPAHRPRAAVLQVVACRCLGLVIGDPELFKLKRLFRCVSGVYLVNAEPFLAVLLNSIPNVRSVPAAPKMLLKAVIHRPAR